MYVCIKSDGQYKNIKEAISQIEITFCTENIYIITTFRGPLLTFFNC